MEKGLTEFAEKVCAVGNTLFDPMECRALRNNKADDDTWEENRRQETEFFLAMIRLCSSLVPGTLTLPLGQ